MSTVIKAEDARRQGVQLSVFSLADVRAQADEMLARARAEAASILDDAAGRNWPNRPSSAVMRRAIRPVWLRVDVPGTNRAWPRRAIASVETRRNCLRR